MAADAFTSRDNLPLRGEVMTVDELARLALETLNTQQRYFRGAAGSAEKSYALEESKKLERQLRQACNEIIDGPKLFT